MAELYITFGVQYGNIAEAQAMLDRTGSLEQMKDPHPLVDWASGNGYLTVVYTPSEDVLEADDPRERARQAAYAWLGGLYAFDYDERPGEDEAPLGELARMVLP